MKLKRVFKRKSVIITAATVAVLAGAGVTFAAISITPQLAHVPVQNSAPAPFVETNQSPSTPATTEIEATPTVSAPPSPEPSPAFNLRGLAIETIEQRSMTEACKAAYGKVNTWKITGDAWLQKVYDLIESNATGKHVNSDGSMVCVYWNTLDELKD